MPISSKAEKKPAKAKPAAKATAASASKPAAKPKEVAKTAATKTAAKPVARVAKKSAPALTPEQRRYYVEVAAYYIAERRGFHGGSEIDDWVQAETEIDRLVSEGVFKP